MSAIQAVVPVKQFGDAKHRLSSAYSPEFRQTLASLMLRDVLDALAGSRLLAGINVVTVDPVATDIARDAGARVLTDGATTGHTGAVAAAVRRLCAEGVEGMLTFPADIPGVTAEEIDILLAGHGCAPAFSIVPAHDGRGSNAVVCSPPDVIALTFGNDSCLPHLAMARQHGLEPRIVGLERIGMDIDEPGDLLAFARKRWDTRALRFLEQAGVVTTPAGDVP